MSLYIRISGFYDPFLRHATTMNSDGHKDVPLSGKGNEESLTAYTAYM